MFCSVFHLFSLLLCIFLQFSYVFFSVFNVFFGFVVFPFQFATHFAIFHAAASQISRVSSILRLFLSILLSCLAILKSFPFNWLYVGLISLYSCRFYRGLMFSFDFTAFWFHFASLLLGSG